MKNIIFVGTAHPYRGGLSFFNEMLARVFGKRGVAVKIYTFTLQYPSFLFPGKTQYSDTPAPDDVRIERRVGTTNTSLMFFFSWLYNTSGPRHLHR